MKECISALPKRKKMPRDKKVARISAQTKKVRFFRTNIEYNNYRIASIKPITTLKSWDVKVL